MNKKQKTKAAKEAEWQLNKLHYITLKALVKINKASGFLHDNEAFYATPLVSKYLNEHANF
jgi:hypothetical protein